MTAALSLLPVTLYYFSPVLSLQGAASGIASGSLLAFFLLQAAGPRWAGRGFRLVLPFQEAPGLALGDSSSPTLSLNLGFELF